MKKMTDRFVLKTSAKDNADNEYHFQLAFYVFPENELYISYCPSLDISTSGVDFNEAVSNFCERFRLYIDWCVEHGTLYDDLTTHGWKVKEKRIIPPSFSSLIKKPEIRGLLAGNRTYEKVVIPARVALCV